jgi:4,5-DOPA dioxygenase extradiol
MVFGGARPAVDAPEIAQSAAFRAWVRQQAEGGAVDALLDYRRRAPFAASMHPTDEHWLPWYPAHGAASAESPATARRLHASITFGCLAMDAYAFGPGADALLTALQGSR